MIRAVKVNAGRCMVTVDGKPCGHPAAFKQILPGSRQLLVCKDHANPAIVRAAEEAEQNAKR